MRSVSVRNLRSHLAELLAEVVAGQTVAITRRGTEVARLVPGEHSPRSLPPRAERRQRMLAKGARVPTSAVARMRVEERA